MFRKITGTWDVTSAPDSLFLKSGAIAAHSVGKEDPSFSKRNFTPTTTILPARAFTDLIDPTSA